MAQQRRGLGRGLGALIPESPRLADGDAARGTDPVLHAASEASSASPGDPVEVFGAHYKEVAVSAITPNPRQPRRVFDEEALDELAESIRQVGLLQPVVVRAAGPGRYELVMGERRWRAAQRAGLTEIGAIVKQTQDDDLLRDALIENMHRQQLDPLEEAAAYQQLLDDFGATHEELARKVGRSRPHISNTLRLLNLPPAVQKRVAAGVLSAGHARALLRPGRPRSPRAPGRPDRGRGPVGPQRRGDRCGRQRRIPHARPRAPAGKPPPLPASAAWPTASPTSSRPASKWKWAATKAKSSSSSRRPTTWSAS